MAMDVRKTYKLFVGGEFVRSESGRAYRVDGAINVPRGSRKDLRDAVRAARIASRRSLREPRGTLIAPSTR